MNEDQQIETIGEYAMRTGQRVAVCVDADPGKAERYISKFTNRFLGLEIVGRFDGPVEGVITIHIQRRRDLN